MGVPSSYMVDGRQYVAVESGWGMDPESLQDRLCNLGRSETVMLQAGACGSSACRADPWSPGDAGEFETGRHKGVSDTRSWEGTCFAGLFSWRLA